MTVALLICVVPPTGNPFVMIAADSRSLDEEGTQANNAKKIFKAGNAYMSTSGSVSDEYREDVARVLGERPIGTIEEKMDALQRIFYEDKRDYDLQQMIVGLVQFDSNGNPQMGLRGINPEGEYPTLGPWTYDKKLPDVQDIYFGATRTEEVDRLRIEFQDRLRSQLDAGKINKTSVENAAKWFIGKVAKVYPDTVNSVVQTKTMRFK